jgi:hypothetical protein
MIISPVTPINIRLFGLFPRHENTARSRYQSGMRNNVLEVFFPSGCTSLSMRDRLPSREALTYASKAPIINKHELRTSDIVVKSLSTPSAFATAPQMVFATSSASPNAVAVARTTCQFQRRKTAASKAKINKTSDGFVAPPVRNSNTEIIAISAKWMSHCVDGPRNL